MFVDNDINNRALIPRPLIKTNPKKQQQQLQQQLSLQETNVIKDRPVEYESLQKQGRGNCYTEPMHQTNCVTSELYLIT